MRDIHYTHILHYITIQYITWHACVHTYTHYTTLHYYITLHYITLHYISLHYTTLHYITLLTYIPERRGQKRKLAVIESFTDCDSEQATADPCLRAVLGTICNHAVEPDWANSLKQSTSNPSTQPRLKGLAVTGSIRFHVRKQPLLSCCLGSGIQELHLSYI